MNSDGCMEWAMANPVEDMTHQVLYLLLPSSVFILVLVLALS